MYNIITIPISLFLDTMARSSCAACLDSLNLGYFSARALLLCPLLDHILNRYKCRLRTEVESVAFSIGVMEIREHSRHGVYE